MPRRFDDDESNLDRGFRERKPTEERPDPEEREKKSWREIDAKRDRSEHRNERSGPSREMRPAKPESQAYRSYKSQLNKLFDGGATPEALKTKMEEAGIGKEEKKRKAALSKITGAQGPRERSKALRTYRESHGFPEDEAALALLLDLDDEPEIVLEALQTVERLLDDNRLKKAGSFKARVKSAKMTVDDDEVFAAAKRLLQRL